MRTVLLSILAATAILLAAAAAPNPQTLSPDNPHAYQIVAEDLIEAGEHRLAQETLATGVLIAADSDPQAAAGMIVLLASLADSTEDHAGLWSLAVTLDPARADDARWLAPRSAPDPAPLREAAQTLTMLRNNDPDAVARLNTQTNDLIIDHGARIGFQKSRVQAVLTKWATDARNDPCRGRLTVRSRRGDAIVIEACPNDTYHHGTRTDAEWRMMVAIELSMANAAPASWATAIGIGLDPPVPAWSLETLADRYGVSRDRPVYRSGRWGPR
ncbi:MAG: hypothetical protein D6692_02835 [Planctomycetota bacterium]|nr:MAG: hypothetical protein D6692_02835 [Planctomycetota bacterium]